MDSILTAGEAELYVDALKAFPISEIGSPGWMQQHDYLEKLNMQAHITAATNTDEFVKEALVSYNKMGLLIRELIAIEVWREKVYPELVRLDFAAKSTMTPYITLYHEGTVVNLLETVLYHEEACTTADDAVLDLLDYCYRRLVFLASLSPEEVEAMATATNKPESALDLSGQQQLELQTKPLPYTIAIKAVSILRYLTDNVKSLPLSCMTRMLNTHDIPCLLVPLLQSPPWTCIAGGQVLKYIDNKWAAVAHRDRLVLTKLEAQVWLALYNLLMEPECRRKYTYSTHNKNTLLQVRGCFNDVLIDQLPVLGELRRSLEELAVMEPPAPEPSVLLEQLPEIRTAILQANRGKWKALAKQQKESAFSDNPDVLKAQAKRLAETYNMDVLDGLLEDPKCAVCGEPAAKRCSRCQNEWYCRRQCQVEHWPKHKMSCDMVCKHLQN